MICAVEIMFQQQKADINGCLTSLAVLAQPVMLRVSPGRLSWLNFLSKPQSLQQNTKTVPYIRLSP
jgi:hypothetical protein